MSFPVVSFYIEGDNGKAHLRCLPSLSCEAADPVTRLRSDQPPIALSQPYAAQGFWNVAGGDIIYGKYQTPVLARTRTIPRIDHCSLWQHKYTTWPLRRQHQRKSDAHNSRWFYPNDLEWRELWPGLQQLHTNPARLRNPASCSDGGSPRTLSACVPPPPHPKDH